MQVHRYERDQDQIFLSVWHQMNRKCHDRTDRREIKDPAGEKQDPDFSGKKPCRRDPERLRQIRKR